MAAWLVGMLPGSLASRQRQGISTGLASSQPPRVLQQRRGISTGLASSASSSRTATRVYNVFGKPLLKSGCVTTETRHLDRLGQLGELEQDSNTDSEQESNTERVCLCGQALTPPAVTWPPARAVMSASADCSCASAARRRTCTCSCCCCSSATRLSPFTGLAASAFSQLAVSALAVTTCRNAQVRNQRAHAYAAGNAAGARVQLAIANTWL